MKLPKNLVKYHEAFISKDEKLLVSHLSNNEIGGGLVAYDIKKDFYLKLNYDQAGTFKQIDVKASNNYHNATHVLKVKFDTSPSPPPP